MRAGFYDFWMQHMKLRKVVATGEGEGNHSYYPVIFDNEAALLKAVELLNAHWVYPRRYFYPSLSTLRYVRSAPMPVCDDLSKRVLCLPLHDTLSKEEIDYVCRLILRAQNNQ
jgi:dTDP-4-amino-4,6-dideoxygalactose transaminase